jgi:hypothetical protein
MGKPFKQELAAIAHTVRWALTLDVEPLRRFLNRGHAPCVLVGSGGSGSASYLLADLLQRQGRICQVMTPLELYHARQQLGDRQVLLLSASGRNKDINFALRVALAQEPRSIGCLTMSCDNSLTRQAKRYALCETFEFDIPTRKDGFLATNTLVGTWAVLLRAAAGDDYVATNVSTVVPEALAQWVEPGPATLIVLYGDRGKPVAMDIESKCTEAGLAAVQLADFRNFGHGRHHWIAKHEASTALVAVVTPGDEDLWAATAALLPAAVPRLVLGAATVASSYLSLLVESFYLIDRLGELRAIDPGRPGVPEFGRQLYHLNPASYHPLPKLSRRELAIQRKSRSGGLAGPLTATRAQELDQAATRFSVRLAAGKFGSLVVDYDGTLGPKIDKEAALAPAIAQRLVAHLEAGFVLGIATGRGKSAAAIMRQVIPAQHWPQVLIGYYNGTVVRPLAESLTEADTLVTPLGTLGLLFDYLTATCPTVGLVEARTHQVTVHTSTEAEKATLLHQLEAYLAANSVRDISLFTSGGCIDAVQVADGSKLNVLAACQELASLRGLPAACVCIGDQGRYPGNDFLLLTTPYSLSVDEVSPSLDSCWNLAGLGQRHVAATQQYLEAITYQSGFFKVALPL